MGGPINVAHIYPFSMKDVTPKDSFWWIMDLFWSKSRVEEWKKAIFTEQRTEVCQNLITLTSTVHVLWGAAFFALKPLELSCDRKSLNVQFFWLRQYKRVEGGVFPSSKPSFPGNLDGLPENIRLWNCENMTPIRSGDIITLHTENPDSHPLPSFALLEMQWFLHRIAALSGAADVYDEFDDDNDDVIECDWIEDEDGSFQCLIIDRP
ncbi:hypothetical protein VTN77DRAFT_6086 [Rasamsonia byssochlamydoides]|uniref:uncharacterized protein n=1 Tax=Rasamsonia byssochlamydoides TaxID=89139 RepID=UPI00374240D8